MNGSVEWATNFSYIFSVICLSSIFLLGFLRLNKELSSEAIKAMLCEKHAQEANAAPPDSMPISFSRTAGALGAIGFAATFIAIGLWVLYSLHFNLDSLTHLPRLGYYFMAAAVFFFPYAVNQLSLLRGNGG